MRELAGRRCASVLGLCRNDEVSYLEVFENVSNVACCSGCDVETHVVVKCQLRWSREFAAEVAELLRIGLARRVGRGYVNIYVKRTTATA